MDLSRSYLDVHYGLRPGKQVERRILIDAFQLFSESGFPVRDYNYIGMGSVHFIDFTMFHKYLGIEKMLSVELSHEIEDRVKFNAPYRDIIETQVGRPIGDFIDNLKDEEKYTIWLDYDGILADYMIEDVCTAMQTLPTGSLLLITIDTEPPLTKEYPKVNRKDDNEDNFKITKDYYEEIAPTYIPVKYKLEDYNYNNLPILNRDIIYSAIKSTLIPTEKKYVPLFNFLYADGHRMLTIGGMVVDSKDERKLKNSRLLSADYIRTGYDSEAFYIKVPILTRKEQLHLDSFMPSLKDWKSDFDISQEDLENYRKIYRFYPSYAELYL